MKRTVYICSALLASALFLLPGCKGKQEEPAKEAGKPDASVQQTLILEKPQIGPHTAADIKKWIKDIEVNTDPGVLMKVEPFVKKFTAGEIVAGIAIKPLPSYWNKASEADRIKTLSIMNTNFSKVRIEAGMAENVKELNSTLYFEDEKGNVAAISDPRQGTHILKSAGNQPG